MPRPLNLRVRLLLATLAPLAVLGAAAPATGPATAAAAPGSAAGTAAPAPVTGSPALEIDDPKLSIAAAPAPPPPTPSPERIGAARRRIDRAYEGTSAVGLVLDKPAPFASAAVELFALPCDEEKDHARRLLCVVVCERVTGEGAPPRFCDGLADPGGPTLRATPGDIAAVNGAIRELLAVVAARETVLNEALAAALLAVGRARPTLDAEVISDALVRDARWPDVAGARVPAAMAKVDAYERVARPLAEALRTVAADALAVTSEDARIEERRLSRLEGLGGRAAAVPGGWEAALIAGLADFIAERSEAEVVDWTFSTVLATICEVDLGKGKDERPRKLLPKVCAMRDVLAERGFRATAALVVALREDLEGLAGVALAAVGVPDADVWVGILGNVVRAARRGAPAEQVGRLLAALVHPTVRARCEENLAALALTDDALRVAVLGDPVCLSYLVGTVANVLLDAGLTLTDWPADLAAQYEKLSALLRSVGVSLAGSGPGEAKICTAFFDSCRGTPRFYVEGLIIKHVFKSEEFILATKAVALASRDLVSTLRQALEDGAVSGTEVGVVAAKVAAVKARLGVAETEAPSWLKPTLGSIVAFVTTAEAAIAAQAANLEAVFTAVEDVVAAVKVFAEAPSLSRVRVLVLESKELVTVLAPLVSTVPLSGPTEAEVTEALGKLGPWLDVIVSALEDVEAVTAAATELARLVKDHRPAEEVLAQAFVVSRILLGTVNRLAGPLGGSLPLYVEPALDATAALVAGRYAEGLLALSTALDQARRELGKSSACKKKKEKKTTTCKAAATIELFLRYLPFLTQLAAAKSAEDVKGALDNFASPVGAWRTKREKWLLSIGALAGIHGGYEYAGRRAFTEGALAFGVFAPVGFDLSFQLGKTSTWGFTFSLIDVGALVGVRVRNRASPAGERPNPLLERGAASASLTSTETKLGILQVFSPGAFLRFGLGRTPLVLGGGISWSPRLRELTFSDGSTDLRNSIRVGAFLAVDIVIFPLSR